MVLIYKFLIMLLIKQLYIKLALKFKSFNSNEVISATIINL